MAYTLIATRLAAAMQQFGFLRDSLRSVLLWPFACLLLGSVIWVLTLSKLDNEKKVLETNALRGATSLSKAYADQLARTVEQIDQITLTLKYYRESSDGAPDLEDQLKKGLYPASSRLYVNIVDRHGAIVTSTLDRQSNPNLSNRGYFRHHAAEEVPGLLISKPEVGLLTNKTIIRFSRRLEAEDGTFDGVVMVSVEPAYLASFYDESHLSKGYFLAVRHTGTGLLAAKIGASVSSRNYIFRAPPKFTTENGVALMPGSHFVDGQSRIIAWQSLSNYPLMSIVGLSEKEALGPYHAMARDYRNFAVAASVLLSLLAIIGMVLSARLAWRNQQAAEVKRTYRLATDGGREGFYMMRAQYGQDNTINDFLLEDCNERGAVLLGMTREKMIGMRVSEIYSYSDAHARHIHGILCHAMETGFYEEEFKVPPPRILHAAWVHRRLVRSGNGLAMTLRDISDTKAHEEALSYLANADALTTLPNRHWLMQYLPMAVENAREGGSELALLFVDLDDFKNINDTLGHAAGDELLQAAASRLKSVIRPSDNVVRLGGDEFTVIIENVESHGDVARVAERIIRALGEPFELSGARSHVVHASIGISMFPRDGDNGETLLKHADIAMYAAKTNGKNYYRFFQPELSANLVTRVNNEQALRKAIERDEFVLHFQPRVDTFSGELRSLEALVRWMHPERGMVPPNEFIPVAEDTGLIVQLGELVIRKACAQLAQWKAQSLPVVPVSINVSPLQFNQATLSALFASCMRQHDIAPSLLEIEITESCMMDEGNAVDEELKALEALGIKLLVDDFGTGFSSLSQLQRLDLDVLKVDRAFTAQLCNGKEGKAFFMAILSMAHVLGMGVVAEGVETVEQLRVLQALSCNEVQGYLIAPPMPPEEVPALLRKRFLFPLGSSQQRPAR
jgi:diguanylate cyclase (GGDEF)-like protein